MRFRFRERVEHVRFADDGISAPHAVGCVARDLHRGYLRYARVAQCSRRKPSQPVKESDASGFFARCSPRFTKFADWTRLAVAV